MYLKRNFGIKDVGWKDIERFWLKVDKTPGLGPKGNCWEWTGSKDKDGYGYFSLHDKTLKAHRFSFLINRKYLPRKLEICHKCNNASCIRPIHLLAKTQLWNLKYRDLCGRTAKGDRHYKAKLTADKVIRLRKLRATGKYTLQQLAKVFGVNNSVISAVARRKIWRHVK